MLGPYFTTTYLCRMESHVLHHGARAIVKHWDALIAQSATGQICVNYERTYKMCIFNIISRLVYGQELPTLGSANPEMTRQWLSNATTYIFVRGIMLLTLPNPIRYFATRLWDHRFNPFLKHVSKLIATRKELLETLDEKEKPPVDLLQALIDCEDPESKMHLTSGQIHSEAMVNLIGGIDTTAFTLTWTTHFLLLYPECYQRAVHEVRSQFPLSDIETVPDITYNMAKASLPFLEACVYETMRMLPIIQTMFPRMVSEEGITIKGHFLPGGTTVFCNIVGSQLNPKHWQDPHRFNPERFLDPATRRTAINSVFTFGYGGRICMGRNLAWMEMLTMLGNMLRHYDFKIPDEFTHIGPNVIDPDTGHPKLMEKTEFVACTPTYRERDCQILVTRANAE
ncbi:hypothetical protein GGF43_000751 [Coemansia sp. RSA 2618]|nr:hypothetical protein GGF43_000751 [Coemansia sp. RSA 2618]